jgi:hypothetical protein
MTARARNGRFTAERTTTETTTTVTERVTVEPPPPPPLGGGPAPVFTHLLTHPPDGARWAHPEFIAAEATRAAAGVIDHTDPFPPRRRPRPEPVTVPAPVPERVPYPPLAEATLALEFEAEVTHEFTGADRERLAYRLGHPW